MENRERILEAAARVYTQHGLKGATTRLIAQEAGVNEVTLFRIFGSKAALFSALLERTCVVSQEVRLPAVPQDPESELTRWAAAQFAAMRANKDFIRKTMSDVGAMPEMQAAVSQGPHDTAEELNDYVAELALQGRLHGVDDDDVNAASMMLMGALFSDAIGRDMMPADFPPDVERAPRLYVRAFLRAIGFVPALQGR